MAKDPGRLAVGDRGADEAEVIADHRRREPLHELRGLPQLDLKDDGETAVAAETREVEAREAAEPLDRIAHGGDRRASLLEAIAHRPLEDGDEEVVLAAEVQVDGAGGDAGRARDVGDLGVEEAAVGEDVGGGAQDQLALGRGAGRRAGGAGAAGDGGGRHWTE